MERYRSIRLRWLPGGAAEFAYELASAGLSHYLRPEGWQPAVNVYRCEKNLRVCVDLAGVEKSGIDLRVEPSRLVLRGVRPAPETRSSADNPRQILLMEIDSGPFLRELILPVEVDPAQVVAEYHDGLLWINLPLASPA